MLILTKGLNDVLCLNNMLNFKKFMQVSRSLKELSKIDLANPIIFLVQKLLRKKKMNYLLGIQRPIILEHSTLWPSNFATK